MRAAISQPWQRPRRPASKADSHADMARRKTEPLVEPLRVDAAVVREQFDELAALRARFPERPLHELLADAAAAAIGSDADVLDQAARGALRAQTRQDAELQAADHPARAGLGDHQFQIGIAVHGLEGPE